jgi:hypothetical protein
MTGHHTRLAVRMRIEDSNLINVHCIAHREALVAIDAARAFLEFQILDRFANNLYEWVGYSTNRCNDLKRLSKDVIK